MFDLDQEVAAAHLSVTEIENQARQIEDRIKRIDGAGEMLPVRAYGHPVSTAAIAKQLTLRSLIATKDPQLASYLGIATGHDRREEEKRETKRLRSEALLMQTERLRAKNEGAAKQRERNQARGLRPDGRGWW